MILGLTLNSRCSVLLFIIIINNDISPPSVPSVARISHNHDLSADIFLSFKGYSWQQLMYIDLSYKLIRNKQDSVSESREEEKKNRK